MKITPERAIELLKNHEVVSLPTESVYGLAGRYDSSQAIEKIYHTKKRPKNNPLIVHISVKEDLKDFVEEIPPFADILMEHFWPGPMTLILPVEEGIFLHEVTAGLKTCAFRVPKHPITRFIIEKCGPLVMPSANLSGRPSATMAEHVIHDFGEEIPVVDGGMTRLGLESTILHFVKERWVVIRRGALTTEEIQAYLPYPLEYLSDKGEEKPLSPGRLHRHYSPKTKMKMYTSETEGVILGFSDRKYGENLRVFPLGPTYDPYVVSANFYDSLRSIDKLGVEECLIDIQFPKGGIWEVLKDRVNKILYADKIS